MRFGLGLAAPMSAIGGKAGMTFCMQMSAFDPKRTSRRIVARQSA